MNTADTTSVMGVLSGAYPYLTVTEEMVLLWANAFATTPTHQVTAALARWIDPPNPTQDAVAASKFAPTIAEMRLMMRLAVSDQARELAWTSRTEFPEHHLSVVEGRRVAAKSYEADCVRRGVVPSWEHWNRVMGVSGE